MIADELAAMSWNPHDDVDLMISVACGDRPTAARRDFNTAQHRPATKTLVPCIRGARGIQGWRLAIKTTPDDA